MSNKKPIMVLLADDTLIAREGWKRILETTDDIKIVGEAEFSQDIQRKVVELNPDLLLVDLKWYGDDTAGESAIQEVKKTQSNTKIIAITAYEKLIHDARLAGADAALTKTFSRDELIGLVRDLASRVNSFPSPIDGTEKFGILTRRETEVLNFMAQGYSDKEISKMLNIANTTVKNHIKNILGKLEARNRTQAINQAYKLNILE